MSINIAIDGPAGAGKSTIAKLLAADLRYIYVDTGAMYRAIALHMLRNNIGADDEESINACLDKVDIIIESRENGQIILLGDEDVSLAIRDEKVGLATSTISAYPKVREKLTILQRKMAQENNVVMDGRDIGTVVLPNADVKVYLTASAEARALRRYNELVQKGEICDLDIIKSDIEKRDHQDMTRKTAPLKQADDAVKIDSSNMTIDEVISAIKALI